MNIIAEKGITLELCPTSNLNTKIVNDIKDYPIDKIINNNSRECKNIVLTGNTFIDNKINLLEDSNHLNCIEKNNIFIN